MPARRDDQVRVVVSALRARGWPPEAMLDGRFRLEHETNLEPIPETQTDPIYTVLRWCDRDTKRLMVKVALELIARVNGTAARRSELAMARRFARYDEGDFWAGFDTETSGSGMPRLEVELIHGIDVWTFQTKMHYRMTLFSELHFVGTLTSAWTGGPLRVAYTFDTREPTNIVFETDNADGAALVEKTSRVRALELREAIARFERRRWEKSERRRGRAPAVSFEDLYPDVVRAMEGK